MQCKETNGLAIVSPADVLPAGCSVLCHWADAESWPAESHVAVITINRVWQVLNIDFGSLIGTEEEFPPAMSCSSRWPPDLCWERSDSLGGVVFELAITPGCR